MRKRSLRVASSPTRSLRIRSYGRPAGLGSKQGDDLAGVAFPVPVERLGPRVEKDEPGRVHRPLRHDEHLREQRAPEPVRGDRIEPTVLDEHRHTAHRVDQLLHVRPDLLRAGRAAATSRVGTLVRGADQSVQMRMLGLVEPKGAADAVENRLRDAGRVAALEPDVVLRAHPGQQSDLFAAQPLHAATAPEVGEARFLRGEAVPP